jgi:hypothetical protein
MTVNDKLLAVSQFYCTPIPKIKRFIPEHPKVKPFTAFRWLIVISCNPGLTKTGLHTVYHTHIDTLNSTVNRLLELGFIKQSNSPYFVVPLNKYRVLKVYTITQNGSKVLSQLLG